MSDGFNPFDEEGIEQLRLPLTNNGAHDDLNLGKFKRSTERGRFVNTLGPELMNEMLLMEGAVMADIATHGTKPNREGGLMLCIFCHEPAMVNGRFCYAHDPGA